MSEVQQQQRRVAHMTITLAGFNQLVERITGLAYRDASPLVDLLTEHTRAVFEDQIAKIVPNVPPEIPPSTPLENQNEGGA